MMGTNWRMIPPQIWMHCDKHWAHPRDAMLRQKVRHHRLRRPQRINRPARKIRTQRRIHQWIIIIFRRQKSSNNSKGPAPLHIPPNRRWMEEEIKRPPNKLKRHQNQWNHKAKNNSPLRPHQIPNRNSPALVERKKLGNPQQRSASTNRPQPMRYFVLPGHNVKVIWTTTKHWSLSATSTRPFWIQMISTTWKTDTRKRRTCCPTKFSISSNM